MGCVTPIPVNAQVDARYGQIVTSTDETRRELQGLVVRLYRFLRMPAVGYKPSIRFRHLRIISQLENQEK